jgi:hypothetical protein
MRSWRKLGIAGKLMKQARKPLSLLDMDLILFV